MKTLHRFLNVKLAEATPWSRVAVPALVHCVQLYASSRDRAFSLTGSLVFGILLLDTVYEQETWTAGRIRTTIHNNTSPHPRAEHHSQETNIVQTLRRTRNGERRFGKLRDSHGSPKTGPGEIVSLALWDVHVRQEGLRYGGPVGEGLSV